MIEQTNIYSKRDPELALKVTKGHFSSDRFHVNYYIDMTSLKMRLSQAKKVAACMAQDYVSKVNLTNIPAFAPAELINDGAVVTAVDTIVCMDGCEVIGSFLAEELLKAGVSTKTRHNSFYIISPEFDHAGQMIVRENIMPMIRGRNVLVVLASAMSGHTIQKAIGTILAYGGKIAGISVIFANVDQIDGHKVKGVFTKKDLPDFKLSDPNDCPDCKAGVKLDAVVNSYGYQKF